MKPATNERTCADLPATVIRSRDVAVKLFKQFSSEMPPIRSLLTSSPSARATTFNELVFSQDVRHGFPNKPTAMAWDDKLKLLALATKNGGLRM